ALIHSYANPQLAEEWDNVGLLIGEPENEVTKILLALDLTENAVNKAIKEKAQLIVTHHPAIFRPLKKITHPLYIKLIKNEIAVLSAHTNFDVTKGGVNSALAEKLNLKNLEFISTKTGTDFYHISVMVPSENAEKLKDTIVKVGGAEIGNYSQCFNSSIVEGEFIPNKNANPSIGRKRILEKVKELKIDFQAEGFKLSKIVRAIHKVHPYETPVYYINQLTSKSPNYGLGFIGELSQPTNLRKFSKFVKESLSAPNVDVWLANRDFDYSIRKIAICGGSGTSLLSKVIGKADVFVSADFTYHTIIDSPIPLIDAGHFYTEQPSLDNFEKILTVFHLPIIRISIKEHIINKLVRM
ncbi:MAG: Nif3-like dinuclear metal center hexameric protein, partial [Candidatus Cloacimonadota bacterium]|nr:Nif3-like dinuclear metal center hexameric protein [Candidatus Cloacimonadota bacterium]